MYFSVASKSTTESVNVEDFQGVRDMHNRTPNDLCFDEAAKIFRVTFVAHDIETWPSMSNHCQFCLFLQYVLSDVL